jgi:PIN domain nuclease of toxin-antitoxin system
MSAYLLDTHVLLWAAQGSSSLGEQSRRVLADPRAELWFSVVSVWEIVIKAGLGRPDFRVDATAIRDRALLAGYRELPVRGQHALGVAELPPLHGDPFDRLLLAQARVENMLLMTADSKVRQYGAGTAAV